MLEEVIENAADAILVSIRTGRIPPLGTAGRSTPSATLVRGVSESHTTCLFRTEWRWNPPWRAAPAHAGTVRDLRTTRRRKDGTRIEVSITRSRIRAPEGREAVFVEILRDITSQRDLDRELLHTEKMAAVGRSPSKVVHEIRNPLGSINLNCDLLIDNLGAGDSPEEHEAREILLTIKRETRRLSQITEEYLQFSRMPSPPAAWRI